MSGELALSNAVSLERLEDTDAIDDTLYSDYMRRATYPDTRAYVTWYNSTPESGADGGDPTYAERAVAAEQFFTVIGRDAFVPDHYYHTDEAHYLAVEEVQGDEIAEEYKPDAWDAEQHDGGDTLVDAAGALHEQRIRDTYADAVDRDTYLEFAAATLLSGNSDMKGENVVIMADGTPVGIDLDHAGGDLTQHVETSEDWEESHYERGMRYLTVNAELLSLDVTRQDIEQATQRLAQDLATEHDLDMIVDSIDDSVFFDDTVYQYSENMRRNIEAFSDGRFPDGRAVTSSSGLSRPRSEG